MNPSPRAVPRRTAPRQPHEPRLARVAAAIADPARSRMLCLLLAGDSATAGELAQAASVAPSTASGHLGRLEEAGIVASDRRGRHRYFRLAGPEVAHALEALALVAEHGARRDAWAHPRRQALAAARCCYGHLAGALGVRLHDTLLRHRAIAAAPDGYTVTEAGGRWLAGALGFVPPPRLGRRAAYPCMDWSERRDHLAGPLATALLRHFVDRGWLRRGEGRVVEITPTGHRHLLAELDAPAGPAPAATATGAGPAGVAA